MSMLVLEGCLLLGLLATFGAVGILARKLHEPDQRDVHRPRRTEQPAPAREPVVPKAA